MGSPKPFFLTEWTTYFLITKAIVLFNMSTVRLDRVSFLYSVKCTAVTDLQPFQPIKKFMVAQRANGGTFALLYSRFYSLFSIF